MLHIILIVVVILIVVTFVEHSLLVLVIMLVLPSGDMALLYCASYYTLRGGYSGSDVFCGAFYINVRTAFSAGSWSIGAALSFVLHIMLIVADLLLMGMLVACFIFLLMELIIIIIGIVALLYYEYTLCSPW